MEQKQYLDDVNLHVLKEVVRRMHGGTKEAIVSWQSRPAGPGGGNFVTGGVFRLEGMAEEDGRRNAWSVIVKIIRPDPDRDDATHYNYWRREALVYESGLLNRLPAGFHAPACHAVEKRTDGSVWLWLEDLRAEPKAWRQEDYTFAARKLGECQAAYLLGKPLPDHPGLNRAWLRSWVNECRRYQPWPPGQEMDNPLIVDQRISRVVGRFGRVYPRFDEWVDAVERLPRTLAHQDYYENNLFILADDSGAARLTVIDWQFASISGIGEDLGRFYGLSLSRGSIPIERLEEHRPSFLESYIQGMREAGWHGDERLSRLGFLVSFAIRSIWEVPKLWKKAAEHAANPTAGSTREEAAIERLMRIAELQMDAAEEVEGLLGRLP